MADSMADDWQVALAGSIGQRVAYFRKKRGMTAQQLSDELMARFGFELKRTALGNLENGLRRGVSIAEVLVIANVLAVPPLLLIVPVGDESFEMLPGVSVDPWYAATCITGEAEPTMWLGGPDDVPNLGKIVELSRRHAEILGIYRRHDAVLAEWGRAWRMFESAKADGTDTDYVRSRMRDAEKDLTALRHELRCDDSALPKLPPLLKGLDDDVSGGGEGAGDQEGDAE